MRQAEVQLGGMQARRLLWVGVILLVLAGVSVAMDPNLLRIPPPHNYDRVPPGTPRAEVYRILGGPGWKPHCGTGIPAGEDPEFWDTPEGPVRVDFNYAGFVIRAQGPKH
jgi:hypothetical protein